MSDIKDTTSEMLEVVMLYMAAYAELETLATEWRDKQITDERFAKRVDGVLKQLSESCKKFTGPAAKSEP